jgi:hypothetical protein
MGGVNEKPKRRGAIGWILLLGAILAITVFLLPPFVERGCSTLLERRDAPMFLPTDCALTEKAPTGMPWGNLRRKGASAA